MTLFCLHFLILCFYALIWQEIFNDLPENSEPAELTIYHNAVQLLIIILKQIKLVLLIKIQKLLIIKYKKNFKKSTRVTSSFFVCFADIETTRLSQFLTIFIIVY
jgi:hypothetical protein